MSVCLDMSTQDFEFEGTTIAVSSLEKSKLFYTELLGFEENSFYEPTKWLSYKNRVSSFFAIEEVPCFQRQPSEYTIDFFVNDVEKLWNATNYCCDMLIKDTPLEAHALCAACRLAEYIPDRNIALNLLDVISSALPKASFYIPNAPVKTYGLTPLHFAPKPDSLCRNLFTSSQIEGHLEELLRQQLPDGGWPIYWETPGPASELEWRGRWTLDALCRLASYRIITI